MRALFPPELIAAIGNARLCEPEVVDQIAQHIIEDWTRVGHKHSLADARRLARLAVEGSMDCLGAMSPLPVPQIARTRSDAS